MWPISHLNDLCNAKETLKYYACKYTFVLVAIVYLHFYINPLGTRMKTRESVGGAMKRARAGVRVLS